jgi:ribonuclease R
MVVRETLSYLAENEDLKEEEPGKYSLVIKQAHLEGKVDMMSSGNAYIICDGQDEDVYVTANNLNTALHGDRVSVFVFARRKGKKLEGEITEILQRFRSEFVGVLDVSEKFAFLIPDSDKMYKDIFIPLKDLNGAHHGMKVIATVTEWGTAAKNPVGKVTKILGKPGENETEMHAILAEYGLPYEFPAEVEDEAEKISFDISKEEIEKRKDLRNVTTITIDPYDAKDFDDALSIQPLSNGNLEIGVHIADVSHYVKENSLLEKEAFKRATSVYLVDRVVPMLPEKLSNGVCSLRPREDKLCFSVLFEIDNAANVVSSWIGRTAIHSNRRFTYEEAQQIIETGQGDFSSEVLQLHRLASIFRKKRFENGALRVEQTEVKFRIDEKGKPVSVFFKESKEANWLIEEFMLLANKYVAIFVGKKEQSQQAIKTFVYRIHDQPNDQKLAELKRFVSNFGYKLDLNNPRTISSSINKMLTDVKGKPEADMIENLTIRSMAKAIYSTENIGHYGLSFDYYSHFTSPIRRYPDVMAHRLLQRYMDGGSSVSKEEYDKKCRHSSDMEKRASDAERASIKYKQVEYLGERIGKTFSGVITGVTEWGVYVEILENKCEGMIRLRDMADDYYHFDEKNYCIRGTRTGNVYRLGDKVTINVKKTDLEKRTIDFEMVGLTEEK